MKSIEVSDSNVGRAWPPGRTGNPCNPVGQILAHEGRSIALALDPNRVLHAGQLAADPNPLVDRHPHAVRLDLERARDKAGMVLGPQGPAPGQQERHQRDRPHAAWHGLASDFREPYTL